MKKKELEQLQHATASELNTKLEESYQELFNLRSQRTTGKLTNSARFGQVKKDIARIKTIQRQREPRLIVVIQVARQAAELAYADAVHGLAHALLAGLGGTAHGGINKAIEVVGLPPIVPAVKQLFLGMRRPCHHREICPWKAPQVGGMSLVDRCLGKIGAMEPHFVH